MILAHATSAPVQQGGTRLLQISNHFSLQIRLLTSFLISRWCLHVLRRSLGSGTGNELTLLTFSNRTLKNKKKTGLFRDGQWKMRSFIQAALCSWAENYEIHVGLPTNSLIRILAKWKIQHNSCFNKVITEWQS